MILNEYKVKLLSMRSLFRPLAALALLSFCAVGVWGASSEKRSVSGIADWVFEEIATRNSDPSTRVSVSQLIQQELQLEERRKIEVMAEVAGRMRQSGSYRQARDLQEIVLQWHIRERGEEDRETLSVLSDLASILKLSGEFASAQEAFEMVYQSRGRLLGPDHLETLEALHDVAQVRQAKGDLVGARTDLEQVLETLNQTLGAEHIDTLAVTRNLAIVDIELGNNGNARQLLEAVAAKQERFVSAGEPLRMEGMVTSYYLAELDRQEGYLQAAKVRYDRILEGIEAHGESWCQSKEWFDSIVERSFQNAIEVAVELDLGEEAFNSLERLKALRQRIWKSDRSPYTGAPLQVASLRQYLDEGTLMLAYNVSEEDTELFLLTREGPLEVYSLMTDSRELMLNIERFRSLLPPENPDLDAQSSPEDRLRQGNRTGRLELGMKLYQTLLEPVEEQIELAERILIMPFGPLEALPFAALVRQDSSEERGWHYLVEWRPLHHARSAASYVSSRLRWSASRSRNEESGETQGPRKLGRREPSLMTRQAPNRSRGTYREDEGEFPLGAFVATLPGSEESSPKVHEIKGLADLDRSAQLAGLRRVSPSQWSLSDESATELMRRYHRHLLAGKPKDESLRAAQLELLEGPVRLVASAGKDTIRDFSAPDFWATYLVLGDWR